MKRALVLVEGQTEERFVSECLAPYLVAKGLGLQTTIIATKRVVGESHVKGGVRSYGQVQRDLRLLLHDTHASAITTLLDYYALPDDFPGMRDRPAARARDRVEHVEATWAIAVGDPRFVPHLVLHELEAWVYAAPSHLEPWMFDDDPGVIAAIKAVADARATPEDIDEGPETAPSKRLRAMFPVYQKTLHGPIATSAIGIDRIRAACPHFGAWLTRLEMIAAG
jgi:Domain of unknown function (DUF4276)